MTIEQQAQALEQAYATYHRMTTQTFRTDEDRQQALQTLKGHLTVADQTLRLPPTRETARARSKLTLWSELTRGTLKEMGMTAP
jgi:hypothetical protein